MNNERLSYEGKEVMLGIDVHRSFFVVCAYSDNEMVKRCRIKPQGEAVVVFIKKYFKDAKIQSCYEAGYSGFWLHRFLIKHDIHNIVVNPASIEVESRNKVKTDKRDAKKMAEQLSAGRLRGIRIPSETEENRRLISRTREQLIKDRTRMRIRIRMRMHQFGIVPEEYKGVLTKKHVEQVLEDCKNEEIKFSISIQKTLWDNIDEQLRKVEKELAEQAKNDPYMKVYLSVPGVGISIARILSNELGDMSQFPNERALFSFVGLVPGEYSSGGKARRGHITRQGAARIRHALTEASWKAIHKDRDLHDVFERIAARRGKTIAITAVARKLIGRVRAAFKKQKTYELNYVTEDKKAA